MSNLVNLIARALLSALFIAGGLDKINGYARSLDYMAAYNVPGFLLPGVIALELVGGLALLAGFMTRWVALALAVFCLLAAVIFHTGFGNPIQVAMFLKNLAIAGGLLLLYAHGGGGWTMSKG